MGQDGIGDPLGGEGIGGQLIGDGIVDGLTFFQALL